MSPPHAHVSAGRGSSSSDEGMITPWEGRGDGEASSGEVSEGTGGTWITADRQGGIGARQAYGCSSTTIALSATTPFFSTFFPDG
jgi:hypothetical protein